MIGLDLHSLIGCTAIGCCALGGYCAYRHHKKIPHPSEIEFIGNIYLFCGCHDHNKFDLLVEVHQIEQAPDSSTCFVEVVCGRFEAKSQPTEVRKGKCDIQERLNLHIRQCDDYLQIAAYKQKFLRNEILGSVDVGIIEDLFEKNFPKRFWYLLNLEGKSSVRVQVSFHKLDTENIELGDMPLSPLVEQALLHAQYEAMSLGKKLSIDVEEMDELQKLRFFSKVLEGPLQRMASFGVHWESLYFKVAETSDGKWEWQYWESKQKCQEGQKPRGALSFLAISVVLPDNHDRRCFYVKYHGANRTYDMFFKRVDRDRNIWSEGLYEFIEKLRAYLEKNEDDKITSFIKKRQKKLSVEELATSSSRHDASNAILKSQEEKLNGNAVASTDLAVLQTNVLKPSPQKFSAAHLAEKMAEGVMYVNESSSRDEYPLKNRSSL